MIDEEEIFALMQAAKDQQAAVERATQAMQTQRGALYDAIAQLNKVQASVAADARLGAERGLSGITIKANDALNVEVRKARETIGAVADSLRVRVWGKSLQWVAGSVVFGFALGLALSWFMWGRNTRDAVNRLDSINAALERQLDEQMQKQAAAPARPVKPPQPHKPQRSQDSEPAPSAAPQGQP